MADKLKVCIRKNAMFNGEEVVDTLTEVLIAVKRGNDVTVEFLDEADPRPTYIQLNEGPK